MGLFLLPPAEVSYISEQREKGGPWKEVCGGRGRVAGERRGLRL